MTAPSLSPERHTELTETLTGDPLAHDLTHAIMRHYGYTDDQILAAEVPANHEALGCQRAGWDWDCTDEDGKPLHPDHDELWLTAALMVDVVVPHLVHQADVLAPLVARWLAEDMRRAWDRGRADGHAERRPINAFGNTEPAQNPYRAALVPGHDHEGGK